MDAMFSPAVPLFATAASKDTVSLDGFTAMGGSALPEQLAMITLAKIHGSDNVFMVRLAHQYGVGEDKELSALVKVDLGDVLPFGMEMEKWEEVRRR